MALPVRRRSANDTWHVARVGYRFLRAGPDMARSRKQTRGNGTGQFAKIFSLSFRRREKNDPRKTHCG